ncbi:50S ribosomal protein L13 [Candidatus Pacearchaeota archaeon]|nr:50S ribosomal protein L13 [Candidatus Pacearchaeota archaeon]
METVVIDAAGATVGRVASVAAKQSLLGKQVAVVNCTQALVAGRTRMVIAEYKQAVLRGGNALNGPNWIKRSPERLMKRTIRGMLSYKMGRGEAAFDRIKCYNQIPAEFKTVKAQVLTRPIMTQTISLADLAKEL